MNIEQQLILGGIGVIQAISYYQKWDSYHKVWKPMLSQGRISEERLSDVKKRMYLPFPFDIITMIKYVKND